MVDRFKEPHDLPSLRIKKSKRTANYNNKSKEKKGTAVAVKLYLLFQSHEDKNKYQSINQSRLKLFYQPFTNVKKKNIKKLKCFNKARISLLHVNTVT